MVKWSKLSERDKVSRGRALYYEPEILILDEATSSLDIETEEKIIDTLKVLKNKLYNHYSAGPFKIYAKFMNLKMEIK